MDAEQVYGVLNSKIKNIQVSGGGVSNYKDLSGKPKINGTTLQGDLKTKDIGINIPETLPNPKSITFDGMLFNQTYDGSEEVTVTFPNVEVLDKVSGTPVGSIEAYMGTIAPPNYLICDGAEYNIADYPYLTQHFIDNFEKANYFGGDGVATFALPDLRGEFLRGSGTASRNTGTGADVGVHQDATNHALINYHSGGNINFGAGGINPFYADKTTSMSSSSRYVATGTYTSKYDKYYTSRPTNTSVLYCIKYQPTYWITPTNGEKEETQ